MLKERNRRKGAMMTEGRKKGLGLGEFSRRLSIILESMIDAAASQWHEVFFLWMSQFDWRDIFKKLQSSS
jgi:hypothetical protein